MVNTARVALMNPAKWRTEMSPQLDHFWRLDLRNHISIFAGTLITFGTIWIIAVIVFWGARRDEHGLGVDHRSVVWGGLYMIAMILGFVLAGYVALRGITLLIGWTLIARMNGWNSASRRRALNASVHGANVACGIFLSSQAIALIPTGLTALIESLFADPEYAAMVWFAIAWLGTLFAVFAMLVFTVNASLVLRRSNLPGSEARLAPENERTCEPPAQAGG